MNHLISIADLSRQDIEGILDTRTAGIVPGGGSVALVFHEPSTRTRFSFTQAIHQVGLHPVDLNPGSSSEQKGETTIDTCRNLAWAGARALVLRTSLTGLPHKVAESVDIPVINAGDGTNEHPTQALGDALALRRHFGGIEGLTVAIVGDVFFSRVARSNAHLLTKLGASVRLVSPDAKDVPSNVPRSMSTSKLEEGLAGADVVMVLRWQDERHPSDRHHKAYYRIDEYALSAAPGHAVVMHPGPVNRDVEVTAEVIDGPRSLIRHQVSAGVEARTKLLRRLLSP